MTTVVIILIIVIVILLFFIIMQICGINNITRQLDSMSGMDTNGLVHMKNGGRSVRRLINKINVLLGEMRSVKGIYRRKNHDMEHMMVNISHDLRTPLTSAMGYVGIITGSDITEEERKRELLIVEQRLVRLEELIDSFFEFSKVISGDKKPDMEKINLVEILQESIVHYYDDFCSQEREVEVECVCERIIIESNRNMLMRVFDNLIANAYKHGTGNLSVKVLPPDESRNIEIRFENAPLEQYIDTDRIFEEFYTTDISRTRGNTGLGLAIAKQFSEILGGNISARFDGAVFSVTVKFHS